MNPQQNQSNDNSDSTNWSPQPETDQTNAPMSAPAQDSTTSAEPAPAEQSVPQVEPVPQSNDTASVAPPSDSGIADQQTNQAGSASSDADQTSDSQAAPQYNPFTKDSASTAFETQSPFGSTGSSQPSQISSTESQSTAPQPSAGTGLAVASLVLGIIAVIPPTPFIPFVNVISVILGLLAIIFGFSHLRKIKKGLAAAGKGMALSGSITGVVAVLISALVTGWTMSVLSPMNGSASSVEVSEYGEVDRDAVSENINTTSTTKTEADMFLGGNPNCESKNTTSETCTYVGGNLEKGLVVVLDFSSDKVTGIQTSFSSFEIN